MADVTSNVTNIGQGRRRVPTEVKRRNGTLLTARTNPHEPKLPTHEIPPAPKDLGPAEQEAWNELREVINPLRTTATSDMVAFELLVDALAVVRRCALVIREEGTTMVETGSTGQAKVRTRPEVSVMLSAQKLVWYGLSRFGCSPADRSRVAGPSEGRANAGEDEFASD
jgi:phage terminase small subunit